MDQTPSSVATPLAIGERRLSFSGYGVRDLVITLFYYKRILVLAFVIPCLLGVAAGVVSKTVFVAQARLLVLYGSDYVFRSGNGAGNDIALDRNQIIQGELQILQSPAVAIETLQAIGVKRVYPSAVDSEAGLQVAAAQFERDLAVGSVPQANVIDLTFRSRDRTVAIDVLGALIDHYLSYRATIFDKTGPSTTTTERDQFGTRLQQAEDKLATFAASHGISNLDDQIALLIRQQGQNVNDENTADQSAAELSARLDTLRREISTVPQTMQIYAETGRSQENSGLTDMLLKLQASRRDLLSRYRDDFPLVQDINRQIAAVQAQIKSAPAREAEATRTGRNPTYDELHNQIIGLEAQLRGTQARRAALTESGTQLQQSLNELTTAGQQYRDLQRRRDVLDQSYRTIARTSEETQMSNALERAAGANVRVVQPPDASPIGINRRPLLIIAGVVLGGMAMVVALAVLNATKQVFVSVHDVERMLGLPVLAAVPHVSRFRRSWRSGQPVA